MTSPTRSVGSDFDLDLDDTLSRCSRLVAGLKIEPEATPVEEVPLPSEPVERAQAALFDIRPDWAIHWTGMPEFSHEDLTPFRSIAIHFAGPKEIADFAALIEQTITERTQSAWYPAAEIGRYSNARYADDV